VLLDGFVVAERQRLRPERAGPDAAPVDTAGFDPDHVRADIRDRPFDARLRSFTDRDHADHRANTDDDAQHRQRRAHDVLAQRVQGQSRNHQQVHGGARPNRLSPAGR